MVGIYVKNNYDLGDEDINRPVMIDGNVIGFVQHADSNILILTIFNEIDDISGIYFD